MENTGIVWEEPPAVARSTYESKWRGLLAPLVEKPGQWARVDVRSSQHKAADTVSNLKRGRLGLPSGSWEFASRRLSDGTGAIYARYLGPSEQAAS